MGRLPLHGHIFPFMGTAFFSYAHLFFQGTFSLSRAHRPLYGHIFFHELWRDGRILPGIGRKSSACYLCQKELRRWEFMGLP